MVWLLIGIVGISLCAILIVAGRAHSRYLDRLEAKWGVVVQIELLSLSSDIANQSEAVALATTEMQPGSLQAPSRIVVVNQACVRPLTAGDRGIEGQARPTGELPLATGTKLL